MKKEKLTTEGVIPLLYNKIKKKLKQYESNNVKSQLR